MIGVATAIIGGAQGIGFAIPVDRAQRIVDDLLRFGEVAPVWVGLRGKTLVSGEENRPRGLKRAERLSQLPRLAGRSSGRRPDRLGRRRPHRLAGGVRDGSLDAGPGHAAESRCCAARRATARSRSRARRRRPGIGLRILRTSSA